MSRRLSAVVLWFCIVLPCLGKPTLFVIGDASVGNRAQGQAGWGDCLADEFDAAAIAVVNRAGAGSRAFLAEGRWEAVMAHLRPGDFVLIQFGDDEGGGSDREALPQFVAETKARGAIPLVASAIHDRGWAKEAAAAGQAGFIDFNRLLADRCKALGEEKTAALFAGGQPGAAFNARVMAEAIRSLAGCDLGKYLHPAELWVPSVFSDHMVLQRDMTIPVWGRAVPGAEVTVGLAGKSATARADQDGKWRIELPKLDAGGPFELAVSSGAARRNFADVLVGEVWLCSGQSNMDFTMAKTAKRSFSGVADWEKEVAAADFPKIRMFSAGWAMDGFPRRDVPGSWQVCSPETAGDFSAVAYYFGRSLQEKLGVPVGLVTCAYGASTIESWIRRETLEAHPQFADLLKSFEEKRLAFRDDPKRFADYGAALAKAGDGKRPKNPDPVQDQHNPFVLSNGMIAPVASYAIRGVIWYQGESNLNTRNLYADLQQTLIGDWRGWWARPDLPFYYVQLAPNKAPAAEPTGGQLPEMRREQAKALAIPHTGMAVTLDIGDEKDVHPRNKLDVGRRLALLALTGTYGRPGESSGPVFRDCETDGARIRVRFDHTAGGLVARDGPLKQFAIAGADGKFVWADAVIEGDTVVVSSPVVPQPVQVRYAWEGNPAGANLFNSENLPAAPFLGKHP